MIGGLLEYSRTRRGDIRVSRRAARGRHTAPRDRRTMDMEKGHTYAPPRQSNAWGIYGACAATVGAIAAIAAAAIAGGLPDGATTTTTTTVSDFSSVISELSAKVDAAAADLKIVHTDPAGNKPFLQRAYASVNGAIDAHYQDWSARIKPIGWHTARLAESGDASDGSGNVEFKYIGDEKDGKTDFGFGPLVPILTIGEHDENTGYVPVGVPDGIGIMRTDQETVRMIYQSESYGNLASGRSWFQEVNMNGAKFTGSHVTYVDYRVPTTATAYSSASSDKLSYDFADAVHSNGGMTNAASTVTAAGSVFDEVYNLAGEKVVARNGNEQLSAGAHMGDTSKDGHYVTADKDNLAATVENAWTFHSFCSAHLEEARQWAGTAAGVTYGVENDIWITNEEWTDLDANATAAHGFSGLSAHVIDLASRKMYAAGVFGLGGFEKIVEFNCGHEDFVCFSPSGYNGNFGGSDAKTAIVNAKKATGKVRKDGNDWVYPQDIVPARVYVGRKGYDATGTKCEAKCGFLERNGLAFGQVYGFAVDTATVTTNRDAWHKGNSRTASSATHTISGKWAPIDWKFNSSAITNVEDADLFHWQDKPVLPSSVSGTYKFWTAEGPDKSGYKTEHNSPSPVGEHKFVQGSTAGYFGIYEVQNMVTDLTNAAAGEFPEYFDASYEMIEGETNINTRINLCAAGSGCTQGKLAKSGKDATEMYDGATNDDGSEKWKTTFEDIDGLEWIAANETSTGSGASSVTLHGATYSYDNYFVIQEDAGNWYGDRMFISKMPAANTAATYNFVAMAGGKKNSRVLSKLSIPAGAFGSATASEFSGVADASGAFRQTTLGGAARRIADVQVAINDKSILIGLQQHSMSDGVVAAFGADRGGQVFMWDVANL